MISLQSKIKFYKKNGFLIIKNILNNKDLKTISSRLNNLIQSQKKNGRGLEEPGVDKSLLYNLHKDKVLKKLIEDKKWFNQISKSILGSDKFKVWNAKSNIKSRWHGSAEYYHQDFAYWSGYGFKSTNMISCMLFIDDHRHYNGGMWVFPGSHKKLYKHDKFININSLQKNLIPKRILDNLSKKYKPIALDQNAGSCIFFDCKLIHGSAHNISPIDRKMILYQISTEKDYDFEHISRINKKNTIIRKKFEKKVLKKRLKLLNEI